MPVVGSSPMHPFQDSGISAVRGQCITVRERQPRRREAQMHPGLIILHATARRARTPTPEARTIAGTTVTHWRVATAHAVLCPGGSHGRS